MSLIEDLRQRKIVQWSLAYLAGAWLVVQLMDALGEPLGLSLGFQRAVLLLLTLGLPAAMTLAWYHGERGRQRVGGPELLILAGLLGLGAVLLRTISFGDNDELRSTPAAEVDGDRPRLAVLLFVNRSQQAEDSLFTEGVHDQILTELSKRTDLHVFSRQSVQEYRGSQKGAPRIAAELGASHLVEGSVQRAGDSVLVTAQLIDAADSHVWAENYQRELTVSNLFGIQREVAARIAEELGLRFSRLENQGDEDLPTESLAAWEAYTQGRLAEVGSLERIERFEEAIRLDSSFAQAWAGLARAHALHMALVRAFESIPPARAALRRAQALDPEDPDVVFGEAAVELYIERDYERAVELLDRVNRLRPNNAELHLFLSGVLRRMGRHAESLAALERGLSLDPRNRRVLNELAHFAYRYREFELARRPLERWRSAFPEDGHPKWDLALLILFETGDTIAYRQEVEENDVELDETQCGLRGGGTREAWLPYLRRQFEDELARCIGRSDAARSEPWFWIGVLGSWTDRKDLPLLYGDSLRARSEEQIARLRAIDTGNYRWPLASSWAELARAQALLGAPEVAIETANHAMDVAPTNDLYDRSRVAAILFDAYMVIGEFDLALDALELAVQSPLDFYAPLLEIDPRFDAIRDRPRFRAIVRKLEQPLR